MNKPIFTKGPWEFQNHVMHQITYLPFIKRMRPIFGLECGIGDASRSEMEANALLIAAAPEMYELLESLVNSPDLTEWWQINRRKMQEVLEKARGEK